MQIISNNRILRIVSNSKNILQKRVLVLIIRSHCFFLCTDHYVLQLSVYRVEECRSNSNIYVIIATEEKAQIKK